MMQNLKEMRKRKEKSNKIYLSRLVYKIMNHRRSSHDEICIYANKLNNSVSITFSQLKYYESLNSSRKCIDNIFFLS